MLEGKAHLVQGLAGFHVLVLFQDKRVGIPYVRYDGGNGLVRRERKRKMKKKEKGGRKTLSKPSVSSLDANERILPFS